MTSSSSARELSHPSPRSPQPQNFTSQKKLFLSITALTTAIESFKDCDVLELQTLRDGLGALQSTLWATKGVSDSAVAPFSMLCLMLCDALRQNLLECHGHEPNLGHVSVMEQNLSQTSERLLEIFHVLSTFLNMRYCIRATLDMQTYKRCMSCVARSIKSLESYEAYLLNLVTTLPVLWQSHYTTTCRKVYLKALERLGVSSYEGDFCQCISLGSNRTVSYLHDVVVIRFGEAAISHFTDFGEQLLKEVDQSQCAVQGEYSESIKSHFVETSRRFQDVLASLKPGEVLASHEILTRGHRIEFSAAILDPDYANGDCSSEART
ncbi:hypothetical protein BJX99DRAFT_100978 [Aspergillus californicus]